MARNKILDRGLAGLLNTTIKGLKIAAQTKGDISLEVAADLAEVLIRTAREADHEPTGFINYIRVTYGIKAREGESLSEELAEMTEQRDELEGELEEMTEQRDELAGELRTREAWPPLDNMADVLKAEALGALMVHDLGLLQDIETLMQ